MHFPLNRSRLLATGIFIGGFIAGAMCTSWPYASAQQRFGKDDVKSVPKSFLEGGDRAYTTLKEIATSSKASADSLARIEKNAGDADRRHRELIKRVDSLDARLKHLSDIIAEAN